MSETEQDDAKRRQRARFADALTSSAQQPGEHSRVGTKVAGATAVLALAAGATLGLGAWRSYQHDEDVKKEKIAAEQAAARKKLTESHSQSPSASAEQKQRKTEQHTPRTEELKSATDTGADADEKADEKKEKKEEAQDKETAEDVKKLNLSMTVSPDRLRVMLKNAHSDLCADVPGKGAGKINTRIQQYRCDHSDDDNQIWNLRVRHGGKGPGKRNLVAISNVKDGLCMDVPGYGGKAPGTKLVEGRCNSSLQDNQLWWVQGDGHGTYRIRNFASRNMCLEVWDDRKTNEAQLQIDKCGTDGDSRWKIVNA